MCSRGGLLDLKNEKCGRLIFLLKQSSAPLCSCLYLSLEMSAGEKLQLLSLRPSYLLSHFQGCDGARRAKLVFTVGWPANLLIFILVFLVHDQGERKDWVPGVPQIHPSPSCAPLLIVRDYIS